MSPEMEAAVKAQVRVVQQTLAPWEAGQMYLNFREEEADARTFYAASAFRRLRKVKAEVDPGELFRANHRIPPAPARTERRRTGLPVRARRATATRVG
jgi:hypothetical protein